MRKGLLLAGAIFGAAILADTANAVTIRIDEEQKIVFGARGIIDASWLGKQTTNDTSDLRFIHRDARVYAKYRFNKFLSAGFQASLWGITGPEVIDSYINISFVPEFQIIAGSFKVPFQRHSGLQSQWTYLFPTGPVYSRTLTIRHVFTNPVADRMPRSSSRSPGLTVWGNIADGMFKYYVGVFDLTDENNVTPNQQKTAYAIRVQFTPTMLGYKPEKGYVLKNVFVGKKDVLTIGLSYVAQPYRNKTAGFDDQSSWGVDLLWEQKFGTLVPNFQIGYVSHDNWGGLKADDRTGWLVQGQLLYDQRIWIGKPAVVFKYVRSDFDKNAFGTPGDPSLTTWGIGVNYFIKGPYTRISFAIDVVDPDSDAQAIEGTKGSWTDANLSIYYNF